MNINQEIGFVMERAERISAFCGCNNLQIKAAGISAKNRFLEGASKANAICAGVKVGLRWKRSGIAEIY